MTGRFDPTIRVVVDDLCDPQVQELLTEHLDDMRSVSPPDSVHALDLDELRGPDITFWTAWRDSSGAAEPPLLLGCGALKELGPGHAEIKSMRTARTARRSGVAALLLEHIIAQARRRGLTRLSLETGSPDFFAPARALYRKYGFDDCAPFADYQPDPYSVYLSRML